MKNLQEIIKSIKSLSIEGKWEDILNLISSHNLEQSNHADIINALANAYVISNEFNKAKSVLENGLKKHEFHADMNFNMGVVYFEQKEYKKALHHFLYFEKLNPNEKNIIQPYLITIKKELDTNTYNFISRKIFYILENIFIAFPAFPAKEENLLENYVGKQFTLQQKDFFVGVYSHSQEINYPKAQLIPVEILSGEKTQNFTITCQNKTVLPIMPLSGGQKIQINDQSKKLEIQNVSPFCFHYYTFEKDCTVHLTSDLPFVVGEPILLNVDSTKPRLILNLFVDGLSQYFINTKSLEELMPQTARFFQKGTICTDAHAAGEWTYVSLANYFTGKYTMNHRLYHPDYSSKVLHHQTLYPELFQEVGYHCCKIDGDWRSVPLSGYAKGMNRILYHHSFYGLNTAEVIRETLEHLYAFQEQNTFMWLCLPDLHDVEDKFESAIGPQVLTDIQNRFIEKTLETTARKKYNKIEIRQYEEQLKRIDMFLGTLYHFIEDNYQEDEIFISLFSDHGQSYVKDTPTFLDEHRTHIPMMLRGKNVPIGTCTSLIQSVDLFPTILHAIGASTEQKNDGNVPTWFGGNTDRSYTLTESLFPNDPYRITFIEKELKICFESVGLCTQEGQIPSAEGFNGKIFDRKTELEVTTNHLDKLKQYEQIMYKHIQEYCI